MNQPSKLPDFIERAIFTVGPIVAGYILGAVPVLYEWLPGDNMADEQQVAKAVMAVLVWGALYLIREFTPLLPDVGYIAAWIQARRDDVIEVPDVVPEAVQLPEDHEGWYEHASEDTPMVVQGFREENEA